MKKHKRLLKKMELLQKIRNREKHTLANSVIAPLCRAGLVNVVEYKPNSVGYKKVELTPWGETWLSHEISKRLPQGISIPMEHAVVRFKAAYGTVPVGSVGTVVHVYSPFEEEVEVEVIIDNKPTVVNVLSRCLEEYKTA